MVQACCMGSMVWESYAANLESVSLTICLIGQSTSRSTAMSSKNSRPHLIPEDPEHQVVVCAICDQLVAI